MQIYICKWCGDPCLLSLRDVARVPKTCPFDVADRTAPVWVEVS